MEEKQIISGIDIGTTKIAVVIADWDKAKNKIDILGVGEASSNGLKKGIVVNMNQTVASLTQALLTAAHHPAIFVFSSFLGITAYHIPLIYYSLVITFCLLFIRQSLLL